MTRRNIGTVTLIMLVVSGVMVAEDVGGSANRDTERQKYRAWLSKRARTWERVMRPGQKWPKDDNPWAPFDLVRMFEESDLVIDCSVKPCLYQDADGKVQYLRLARSIQRIEAVYKGEVRTDVVTWKDKRQLTAHVVVDEMHSGHWGWVDLTPKTSYLLFLTELSKEERSERGYEKEQGRFYKINRIWHGAIQLDDKKKGSGSANSYLKRRRNAYSHLAANRGHFVVAVEEMARDQRTPPSESRFALLKLRAKLCHVVKAGLDDEGKAKTDRALKQYPDDVLNISESVMLYRKLATTKDKNKQVNLQNRILFLDALARDMVKFAGLRRQAATQPSAKREDKDPKASGKEENQ